ncbi:MAG: carbonic anhydrase [Clostridiaceae bacterium]|nr:carbonic anhydrase [Clostridiaceae bacterium]
MVNLLERLKQFKATEYDVNREKYDRIVLSQKPHTLFITCSDSRIDVEKILQAEPGEIFHIRNIANIVPREKEPEQHPAVISAIEYAVKVLGVENIIVCGHSNCGGCAALMHIQDYEERLPYTSEWIRQSILLRDCIVEKYPEKSEEERVAILERLNVAQQLDNLMTYDFVRQKVEMGSLRLMGYFFNLATGIVSEYIYEKEMADLIEVMARRREKQRAGSTENA